MNRGNPFLSRLISCAKERRIPWRFHEAFGHIKQKAYLISNKHFLKRFSSEKEMLNIEISNCNLKCAMCARSTALGLKNHETGMMSLVLFRKIIKKILAEKFKFKNLMFGNFGEPLLNYSFSEMVSYAKSKLPDTTISVYTNLTYLKDPDAIIDSGLDCIRVSISGMTQDVYSRNHIGGEINTVLSNLKEICCLKKRLDSKIRIIVRFHDYLYNKGEAILARDFCNENEIEFELLWCYIPCVEANIKFHKDKQELTKLYGQFIDLDNEERLMHTLPNYKKCLMLNEFVVIDFDGRLYRCCGVYEEKYLLGSFFDYKIRNIHRIKSKICELCSMTPISWR